VEGELPQVDSSVDLRPLLGWLGDFLAFQSTPLHEVAREIEAMYGVRVRLPDSALGARTVTAVFSGEPVEQVLTVVCRIVDAHCLFQDSVATIEP
jgi:ferric-dicitrate binding protein FerR (iron transport regulator)